MTLAKDFLTKCNNYDTTKFSKHFQRSTSTLRHYSEVVGENEVQKIELKH